MHLTRIYNANNHKFRNIPPATICCAAIRVFQTSNYLWPSLLPFDSDYLSRSVAISRPAIPLIRKHSCGILQYFQVAIKCVYPLKRKQRWAWRPTKTDSKAGLSGLLSACEGVVPMLFQFRFDSILAIVAFWWAAIDFFFVIYLFWLWPTSACGMGAHSPNEIPSSFSSWDYFWKI